MDRTGREKAIAALLAALIGLLAFGAAALLYFGLQEPRSRATDLPQTSVPYEAPIPANLTILLQNEALATFDLLHFDFRAGSLTATLLPAGVTRAAASDYGYEIDRTILINEIGLAALIDRFGGVEPETGAQRLRLTGEQAVAYLRERAGRLSALQEARAAVLLCLFENIAALGLTKDDFLFLTEQTTTDLSYPDFYDREKQLPALCGNCMLVNEFLEGGPA